MTFPELSEKWLQESCQHLAPRSLAAYQSALNIAGRTLSSLNGELSAEFTLWQKQRRDALAASSFSLELVIVRKMLNWGKKAGHVTTPDCWSDVKPGKVESETFTIPSRAEFERIVAEIRKQSKQSNRVADFIEFLASSGCRKSEAFGLQWRDIDFAKGTILIARDGRGKTGSRLLPLFDRLNLVLLRQPPGQPTDFVWGVIDAKDRLDTACRKLNLPHVRVHDLRHYACVQWLKAAGINRVNILARYAGHSTQQFLNRYSNHCTESEFNETAKLIQ